MDGNDVANTLIHKLLELGFTVHRYNAYSTSSIYLKLDFRCMLWYSYSRPPRKKKYRYRFNVIKDYVGDKVILRNGLICRFFNYNELENVLTAVKKERETKLNRYGLEKYKTFMKEQSQTDLYTRFNEMKGKEEIK